MSNKIKYGLKSVYFAVATIANNGTATYATPVAFPGAVSLSLTANGDNPIFYADNVAYWTGNGNNGYSGTLEMAYITDEFREKVLNEVKAETGVYVESLNAPIVHFALLFQFEGDDKGTRHVLYNCTASRPDVAGNTKGEQIEPQTETINLDCKSIYNATLDIDTVKARATEGATPYNNWFLTTVYQATTISTST